MIVDALNAQAKTKYLVACTGGYEQPSFAIESSKQAALDRADGWQSDMDHNDQIDILAINGEVLTSVKTILGVDSGDA